MGPALRDQRGQALAEYGVLVAVIALVVLAAAILVGGSLLGLFNSNASGV